MAKKTHNVTREQKKEVSMTIFEAPDLDEAIEAGARNAYAKYYKTNGPYSLSEYARQDIMKAQHEMARYVVEGFLAFLAKNSIDLPNQGVHPTKRVTQTDR